MPARRPTIALLPAHPKQLWMMQALAAPISGFADMVWVLRDKDCIVELAEAMKLDYVVISRAATGRLGNALELAANVRRACRLTRARRIDLWMTKYGCANIGAALARSRSISFNDDDVDIIPLIAWTSYPFARAVLTPDATRMGRFARKTLSYSSYQELLYLHPNRFAPDPSIYAELGLADRSPFAVVRLSALQSHHDTHIRGVNEELLRRVLQLAAGHEPPIRVFVSSEKPLAPEFEPHRFPISAFRMHHALGAAEFFVGDSQSMTTEAAVLGVPALRINSFVGRISSMNQLEDYGLSFGFLPNQEEALAERLKEILALPDRRACFAERRRKMLADKIDPLPWFVNVIERAVFGASLRELQRAGGSS